MRPLKYFDEYLKEGIVKKRTPDKRRSESLKQEAERRYGFLKEVYEMIEIKDENANYFVEMCYDIIISLIRSIIISKGYYASGKGAHKSEVSYMKVLNFDEKDIRFMDELRYFRNGIKYYGKIFDKKYGEKVMKFLEKIYQEISEKYINYS